MRLVVNEPHVFDINEFNTYGNEFWIRLTLPIEGVEISNGVITINPEPETELNG